MPTSPAWTDEEIKLVLDLLKEEQRELPPEIHHTDNRDVKDDLEKRLQLVNALIQKLQHAPVH
jgi:hypothetical protein